MNTNEKEIKKSRLWGLWTTINDFESAIEAARNAQILAFWLSLSYSVSVVSLFWRGKPLFGETPSDNIELNLYVGAYILITLLFLSIGFRIRKNSFGFVPFLAAWSLFEITGTALSSSGHLELPRIIIPLIMLVITINSLRGWFGIRKYWFSGNPLEKTTEPTSKFIRFSVIFFVIILTASGLFAIATKMGMVTEMKVLSGKDLPYSQREELVSNNIILKSDKIIYFYSEGLLSVTYGGQFLTEDRIVRYGPTENNQLEKYSMLYKNIKTIELVEQGNSLSDSVYKIIGNENASYEFIMMFLPGTDTKFIKELERHLG